MTFKIFYHLFLEPKYKLAIVSAVLLTVTGTIVRFLVAGDNISEPLQTVLISLTVTCYTFLVGAFVNALVLAKKHQRLSGKYIGYAYKSTDKNIRKGYYERQETPQSEALLEYVGGDSFIVTLTAEVQKSDLTWKGDMKIISSNMAEIAWWYLNKNHKDSIGFKKAVITEDAEGYKIVMFSNDNSFHERELFVKLKQD